MLQAREIFLDRYSQLEHVRLGGPSEISFVHNHRLLRASKVYLNIYHLWPKWVNGILSACGLAGGFHSAIEVCGTEYQFRGCSDEEQGIFETDPAYSLKSKVLRQGMKSLSTAEKEIVSQIGILQEHRVLGLWSGSKVDFDLLMCHLKEQRGWRGPNYKMLSFNCNHFVLETCGYMMEHHLFHPAKEMTSKENMVPKRLFRLSGAVRLCCSKSVTKGLDEDVIPPANGKVFAFRGKPYMLGVATDKARRKLNRRVIKSSAASLAIGTSKIAPSGASSSAMSSSANTIEIAYSSDSRSNLQLLRSKLPSGRAHRSTSMMARLSGSSMAGRHLEKSKGWRERDRDRYIATTSSSSYENTTGTDSDNSRYIKNLAMGEITEEAIPSGSQHWDRSKSKKQISRSPSRISPRKESPSDGVTRLIGYKSIDDVRWLDESARDRAGAGHPAIGNLDRCSAKSSSSTMSKPPSLGIGVELRAKPSRDFTTAEDAYGTRQPSALNRDVDDYQVGIHMTPPFASHVSSSSESLSIATVGTEASPPSTRRTKHSSGEDASSIQTGAEPLSTMSHVIGNPTFVESDELTVEEYGDAGYIRGGEGNSPNSTRAPVC
ncbi:hypothetical protein BSKO_02188 [Bryopsis sp. KO-2023]|nr:hypothetical protein BSKO_02188 [Bryopsis sp. KO-2023]